MGVFPIVSKIDLTAGGTGILANFPPLTQDRDLHPTNKAYQDFTYMISA